MAGVPYAVVASLDKRLYIMVRGRVADYMNNLEKWIGEIGRLREECDGSSGPSDYLDGQKSGTSNVVSSVPAAHTTSFPIYPFLCPFLLSIYSIPLVFCALM